MMRIAITAGEPAGIGPDLLVELSQTSFEHELVAITDPELLETRAKQLGRPFQLTEFNPNLPPKRHSAGVLKVKPISLNAPCKPGQLNTDNAHHVLQCLTEGVQGCLKKSFDALVTGPVQKNLLNQAGIPFTGQTEFLAESCQVEDVVMMLATDELRVALATTHLPLRTVADAISPPKLQKTIEILHHDLQTKFGIPHPKIYVCGLNPHAGEGGFFGREEIEIIKPVILKCQKEGIRVHGPYSADTLFTFKEADVFLAMYHDQGLPVLKNTGFGKAVNITLGLPIIRTSPDHGTALDLAGTGKASVSSFQKALQTAVQMAECTMSSSTR